jgi:hypothetical protein
MGAERGERDCKNFYADMMRFMLEQRKSFRTPEFAALVYISRGRLEMRPIGRGGFLRVQLEDVAAKQQKE